MTRPDARSAYDAWHERVGGSPALQTPWHRLLREALDVRRDLAGRRVLEIACGRGDFAGWCAALATPPAMYVAADFSGSALRIARQRAGGAVACLQADAQAIGVAGASVDTVVCCETVEHLHDPAAAVGELARILKPGGRLFLTAPNYLGAMGLYRGYLRLTGRRYTEDGQPVNRFLLAPLVRHWIRAAGLRVLAAESAGHYLPWPGRPPILVRDRSRLLSPFGHHSLTVACKP
jgi:ubiquinone/menaquinone biosynthesis C-methylase UbiE